MDVDIRYSPLLSLAVTTPPPGGEVKAELAVAPALLPSQQA